MCIFDVRNDVAWGGRLRIYVCLIYVLRYAKDILYTYRLAYEILYIGGITLGQILVKIGDLVLSISDDEADCERSPRGA